MHFLSCKGSTEVGTPAHMRFSAGTPVTKVLPRSCLRLPLTLTVAAGAPAFTSGHPQLSMGAPEALDSCFDVIFPNLVTPFTDCKGVGEMCP